MALTPDITVRGRMPTPAEYKKHLELLEDVEADEKNVGRSARVFDRWLGRDMSDLQHEVWVAVHQQGLVKQGRDMAHRLTPYGKTYLEQRRGKKNPAEAFSKKDLAREIKRSRAAKLKLLRENAKAARARKRAALAAAASQCRAGRDRAASARALAKDAAAASKAARLAARGSCSLPVGVAALRDAVALAAVELRAEEAHMRAIREADRAVASRTQKPGVARARERASESDDEVRSNIPPELVGLFNRVRRGIKGSSRKSRTEAFLEYVEEHPGEAFSDVDDATDRMIAEHERALRSGTRNPPALVVLGVLVSLRYQAASGPAHTRTWGDRGAPFVAYAAGEGLVIVFGAQRRGNAPLSSRAEYSKTHWGLAGKGQRLEGDRLAGVAPVLGKALTITYATRKGEDRSLVNYVHEFGDGGKGRTVLPVVRGATVGGRAMVRLDGGSYHVSERGIVG